MPTNQLICLLLLAIPMGCGLLVRLLWRCSAVARATAVLASGATLVLASLLVQAPRADFQWGAWSLGGGGLAIEFRFLVTPLGAALTLAAAGFALLIALHASVQMAGHEQEGKFHAYLLMTLSGTAAVLLADHLLVLLIGWEVVTVLLFLMVNLNSTAEAKAAAGKSFVILGFADAAMLLGIVLLAASGRSMTIYPPAATPVDSPLMVCVYLLLAAGALAKAGAVPLHSWIPASGAAAPAPVMALLPASLDKLLGIYLLFRISWGMFSIAANPALQAVLMAIGAVTIVAAVMMAMVQHGLKKLLSFHAVSQVGYMVLGIGTGSLVGVLGGLFHMVNHTIYKSCLFLGAGAVEKETGTDELDALGGLARVMPVTFACMFVAAMSISGVPPFNGFSSKWMIYQGVLAAARQQWVALAFLVGAVFGSALTLASFVKVLHSVFFGPRGEASRRAAETPRRENVAIVLPMVVLAAACVLLGVWPQGFLADVLQPAVGSAAPGKLPAISGMDAMAGPLGLWSPTRATGLLAIAFVLGGLLLLLGRVTKFRVGRTFLCGEVREEDPGVRVSGTEFYRTIGELPLVGAMLRDGAAEAYDPYRLIGQGGGSLVQVLRRAHTGVLPLYVTWVLAGLLTILLIVLQAG